jgi:23S rRNA (guanosine2251-2'-O)-methyltransferase
VGSARATRVICGLQPVREAIRAHGARLARVVVEATKSGSPELERLARFAGDHGVEVARAPRSELDRMAGGARHQGAIAFAPELALVPLADLALDARALVVALDELEDPQNFGAILRSAVALGASAVLWPEHRSAPLTPATFRASAGAVEHARLCRVPSLPRALEELARRGLAVIGLDASATRSVAEVDLTGAVAVVVGSEGRGLRKTVKAATTALAHVPMAGVVGSLNASVAVGIALYEARRQRAGR